jgi:predicted dehydrogenase
MAMKKLKVGIIGAGNMGRRHGRAYRYHEARTQVVACFDVVPEAARRYSKQFGCEAEESLEALLVRSDIDAVSICTTEEHHLIPVLMAAEAGKHILLEKPMAINLADALAMKSAVEKAGINLMVGHLYRFDQRSVAIKNTIDGGKLGRLNSIACSFHGSPAQQDRIKHLELSIAVFRGSHAIDLMRWFTGSEVKRIYAESIEGKLRSDGYHSEDAIFCLMRFENDVVASMEINSHVPEGHPTAGESEMTIIGSDGMISIDFARPWFTLANEKSYSYEVGNQKDLWFREEIDAFLRVILENEPCIATPDEAISTLKVSLAAVESARTHHTVDIN